MDKDKILRYIEDYVTDENAQQIADREHLYVLKILPYTPTDEWNRIYTRGSGGAGAQDKAMAVGIPKFVQIAHTEILYFFDSELVYFTLTNTANGAKRIPIIKENIEIGYLELSKDLLKRAYTPYINSEYLGIKQGDIITTAAAKLFGADASTQEAIDYSPTGYVFAEWSDCCLVGNQPKPYEFTGDPYKNVVEFGLSQSHSISENATIFTDAYSQTILAHTDTHNIVNGINIVPHHAIVGMVHEGDLITNQKWIKVERYYQKDEFTNKRQYMLYKTLEGKSHFATGDIVFSLHGHRVIEFNGIKHDVICINDIFAYNRGGNITALKEYQLFTPVEGNIVEYQSEKYIFVHDILGNFNVPKKVQVMDRQYILGFKHQLIAKL